jgi:DNA-directed RNA polymerase subunit alpha
LSELLNIKCIEHKINETKNHYGRFTIGPLNIGQGITVGNSLRRTLLSDITGVAITNARINVENNLAKSEVSTTNFHEFSTIPGIRESVLEILLNLKNIVLSDDNTNFKEIQKGFINVEGPYRITANDLVLPNTINVVDSNQYIATIISNQTFSMEVSVKQGRGITEITNQDEVESQQNTDADLLTIDATYIPIKKVNYIVEEKTLGNSNSPLKEMVILEVWTNGSIKPQDAVSSAIETLADLYQSIQSAIII